MTFAGFNISTWCPSALSELRKTGASEVSNWVVLSFLHVFSTFFWARSESQVTRTFGKASSNAMTDVGRIAGPDKDDEPFGYLKKMNMEAQADPPLG